MAIIEPFTTHPLILKHVIQAVLDPVLQNEELHYPTARGHLPFKINILHTYKIRFPIYALP